MGGLVGWLVGWLAGWLVGWLVVLVVLVVFVNKTSFKMKVRSSKVFDYILK